VALARAARPQGDDVLVPCDELASGEIEDEFLVQAGDGVEVEALEALDRREPGGLDPTVDHPGFAVEQLELDQARQIANMIDTFLGALAGQLLMLAQHRRQLQPLEMMAQQQVRRLDRLAHGACSGIRAV
jgi:hypothetical protein